MRISDKLWTDLTQYIDKYYVKEIPQLNRQSSTLDKYVLQEALVEQKMIIQSADLDEMLEDLADDFTTHLLKLIDQKGLKDVETYKKARVDRKLFSKIKSTPFYQPQKKTVIAFAIALELTVEEAIDLLYSAGYTLSNSHKFDVIIQFFLEHRMYDLFVINEALHQFNQPLIGV